MTSNQALVSVVVPIHNAGRYLDRTRKQLADLDPGVDYEFILIDDHSNDDSLARIREWDGALPGSVRVLEADSRGVANARNQALEVAMGDFIWMTDADDNWSPRIVVDMYTTATEDDADLVVCNAVKRTPAGSDVGTITDARLREATSGEVAFSRLLDGQLQGHLWNKLFARSLLRNRPFPPTRAHSDLGGVLRTVSRAKTVAYLPAELYVYVQNPGSILNSKPYVYTDLATCFDIATSVAATTNIDTNLSITSFKYRNFVIPTLNELGRRTSSVSRHERTTTIGSIKSNVQVRDMLNLIEARASRNIVLRAALIQISAAAYVSAYATASRIRSRRSRGLPLLD